MYKKDAIEWKVTREELRVIKEALLFRIADEINDYRKCNEPSELNSLKARDQMTRFDLYDEACFALTRWMAEDERKV